MIRVPILVWRDAAGVFGAAPACTGQLGDRGAGLVAHGSDEATAVDALARLLAPATGVWATGSIRCLRGARLKLFQVRVRPVHLEAGRSYSARHEVEMPVVCVHGQEGDGLLLAVLPFLGAELRFHEGQSLGALVAHAALERFQGLSPEQLAAQLPPVWMALRELTVARGRERADRGEDSSTPTLSLVADPLGAEARRAARAWERDTVVEALVEAISTRRASILVVGEHGCGKSLVIAEAMARLRREARSGTSLWQGRSAWLTSAARILADMRYLGDWQARCERLVAELRETDGLLVFDDLLEILRGSQSIGGFLMPFVIQRQLQIVAECTPAELVACRRLDPGLLDELQIIRVESCDHETSLAILQRVADAERRGLGAEIDVSLPESLLELCERFAPHRTLPGLPVELLRQLCEETRVSTQPGRCPEPKASGDFPGPRAAPGGQPVPGPSLLPQQENLRGPRGFSELVVQGGATVSRLTAADAVDVFVRRSGLPRHLLLDQLPLPEDEVVSALAEEVLGQEPACRAVASVVVRFKAGLCDPERPLGVVLFCGPTGVGKTALARALARYLFGQAEDSRLVRLDMSEYATPLAAARLLGVGGEPGELVRGVRAQPFSVVLLDEIDKATPEALQSLLGILDAGRSTDELGRVTSFQSAIFVLTSNLGAGTSEPAGFGQPAHAPLLAAEVEEHLGAELAGALDAAVQFQTIDRQTASAIVQKELAAISRRDGLRDLGLELTCTPPMLQHLIDRGFDPRYGARPLQRTLEREVVAPLARHLIQHPHLEDTNLTLDHVQGEGTRIRAEGSR